MFCKKSFSENFWKFYRKTLLFISKVKPCLKLNTQNSASVLPIMKLPFSIKSKYSGNFFLSRFPFAEADNLYDSRVRLDAIFISCRTFRYLFSTLHLIFYCIFDRVAINYQTATWWTLLPSGIRIWVIVSHTSVGLWVKRTDKPSVLVISRHFL